MATYQREVRAGWRASSPHHDTTQRQIIKGNEREISGGKPYNNLKISGKMRGVPGTHSLVSRRVTNRNRKQPGNKREISGK